jgi:hypothetical protein
MGDNNGSCLFFIIKIMYSAVCDQYVQIYKATDTKNRKCRNIDCRTTANLLPITENSEQSTLEDELVGLEDLARMQEEVQRKQRRLDRAEECRAKGHLGSDQ